MFLGLDSSTQSLSAILIDPERGRTLHECSVSFGNDLPEFGSPKGFLPDGRDGEVHANPLLWLAALNLLLDRLAQSVDLSQVKCIAGSGQQHGSVYLDDSFESRLKALDPTN